MAHQRKWRPRVYHFGAQMNNTGGVAALCYVKPRSIDLTRASWVLRESAVTCPKCLALLAQRIDSKET